MPISGGADLAPLKRRPNGYMAATQTKWDWNPQRGKDAKCLIEVVAGARIGFRTWLNSLTLNYVSRTRIGAEIDDMSIQPASRAMLLPRSWDATAALCPAQGSAH
jgi:hypothetical protein